MGRRLTTWAGALALAGGVGMAPVAAGTAQVSPAGAVTTPSVSPPATTVTTCTSQSPGELLPGGEPSLFPGACMVSPNHQYELIMQSDGNLVLYYQPSSGQVEPLWASNTAGNPGAFFRLQGSGFFGVLNSANTATLWAPSEPWISNPQNPVLALQDDGNLVLYTATNGSWSVLWATGTNGNRTNVTTCTQQSPSSIADGASIQSGGCLASSDQDYDLDMQSDGNLVLYYHPFSGETQALWDSGTAGNSGAIAEMQTDGNLVVYSTTDAALWSSDTVGTPNPNLIMQADGNAVVYGSSAGGTGYAAWSSGTENLRGDQLASGDALEPGQYLESANGQYGIDMGKQGVLVLYTTGVDSGGYQCPVWSVPAVSSASSNSVSFSFTNLPGAYLQVTSVGDLALWRPGGPGAGASMWDAGTSGSGNYATLQNDGNFVVYNSAGTAQWSTGTATDEPNHGWLLCTGSTLQAGQSLTAVGSTSGSSCPSDATSPSNPNSCDFTLTMSSDCNLTTQASITPPGQVVWQSNTNVDDSDNFTKSGNDSTLYGDTSSQDYSGCYAEMGADGDLEIFAPNTTGAGYLGVPHLIWASNTNGIGPQLQMPVTSFGPYLAFPNYDGSLDIANGAGVIVGSNPEPGDVHTGVGGEVGKEIGEFALQVFFTFLFL